MKQLLTGRLQKYTSTLFLPDPTLASSHFNEYGGHMYVVLKNQDSSVQLFFEVRLIHEDDQWKVTYHLHYIRNDSHLCELQQVVHWHDSESEDSTEYLAPDEGLTQAMEDLSRSPALLRDLLPEAARILIQNMLDEGALSQVSDFEQYGFAHDEAAARKVLTEALSKA